MEHPRRIAMASFFRVRSKFGLLIVAAGVAMSAAFAAPSADAGRERWCDASAKVVRHGRVVEIRLPAYGDRVIWRGVLDDQDAVRIRRVIREVQRDVHRQVVRDRIRVIVDRDEVRRAVRRVLERVREIRLRLEDEDWI
jgi:hypothetical protein